MTITQPRRLRRHWWPLLESFAAFALAFAPLAALAEAPVVPRVLEQPRAYLFPVCPITNELNLPLGPSPVRVFSLENGTSENAGGAASDAGTPAEPLIDLGLDAVGGWLDERAQEGAAATHWLTTGRFPRIVPSTGRPHSKCLVLIDGRFVARLALIGASRSMAPGESMASWDWPDAWQALFQLDGPPRLYLEIELQLSPDNQAVRLIPRFLDLRLSKATGERSQPVHLGFTASLAFSGSPPAAATIALPSPIPEVTRLLPLHFMSVSSAWIHLPKLPRSSGDAYDKPVDIPLSVQAALVESTQPTKVETLLARIFAAAHKPR